MIFNIVASSNYKHYGLKGNRHIIRVYIQILKISVVIYQIISSTTEIITITLQSYKTGHRTTASYLKKIFEVLVECRIASWELLTCHSLPLKHTWYMQFKHVPFFVQRCLQWPQEELNYPHGWLMINLGHK